MSDNVAITPGSGASVATDIIGGAHYQRVKIAWGADGTADDVSASDPFPVEVVDGALTLSGEDHIGQLGGHTVSVAWTPVINTSQYTADDQVGEDTALALVRVTGGSGVINSVSVLDLGNQKAALTILFFDADITDQSNNSAYVWNSGDYTKFLGCVQIAASNYVTIGGEAVASVACNLAIVANGSANIYAVICTQGTPTYTSTSDLRFRIGVLQD